MIDWDAIPLALWAYIASTLLASAVPIVRVVENEHLHRKVELLILAVLLYPVWGYFLLRRVRWLWIGTIALIAVFTVGGMVAGTIIWWALALSVIQVALLLTPATRRYFERGPGTRST